MFDKKFIIITASETPTEEEAREASSPETPAARLTELAHRSKPLALLVAQNPHAPGPLLEKLASPTQVRIISSNPPTLGYGAWTDPEKSEWMVDEEVRREIAKNPNTPPKILLTIACHFPAEVSQNPATQIAFLEDSALLYQLEPGALMVLVGSKEFEHLAPQIAAHPDKTIRARIAADYRAPMCLSKALMADPDPRIKRDAKAVYEYQLKNKK